LSASSALINSSCFQAVEAHLVEQMPLRNLKLFIALLAFELRRYAIKQSLRQVHAVGGRHKHDVRQVEIDFRDGR
jgi:hypothetical protein